MSNFDRLGQKDAAEKQSQVKDAGELTRQLEMGAKKLGLDTVHDARLVQLKYLSSGGKKYDATLLERFDFDKQTNVETDRHGRPKTEQVKNPDGTTTEKVKTEGKPGVQEFLQPFVDIKNVFGQGFLDHALYDYNIPYTQLEAFSKELSAIDQALRQGQIKLTIEEQRALLTELEGGKANHQQFLETQKNETLHIGEMLDEVTVLQGKPKLTEQQKEFLGGYFDRATIKIDKAFAGDQRMNIDVAHNLRMGFLGYMSSLLVQEMQKRKASKSDGILTSLDIEDIKKTTVVQREKQIDSFLSGMRRTTQCAEGSQVITFDTFADINELRSPDLVFDFLQKTGLDPSKVSFTKKAEGSDTESTGTNITKHFSDFVTELGKVKKADKADVVAAQAGDFLTQGAGMLEKGIDHLSKWIDKLDKSGVLDKLKKFWDLLFGDGDFLDRLSKFNEMNESKLGPEKQLALEKGFSLIQDLPTGDKLDYLGVKGKMEASLFPVTAFDATEADGERGKLVKDAATQMGGGTYEKLLAGTPEAKDVMDVSMRAMCGKDEAAYTTYRTTRDTNPAGAQALFVAKFRVSADVFHSSVKPEELGKKPNETFARGLLATILDNVSAGKGVVKAATNETQQGIDKAKQELEQFTQKMSMRVENNVVKIEGIPAGQKAGIKVGETIVPYTDTGISLASLGTGKEFSLIKEESPGKRSEKVRTDVPVITPSKVEKTMNTENTVTTGLKLTGLPTTYDLVTKVDYLQNNATTPHDGPVVNKPATEDIATPYGFDQTKGEPKQLRVKPKDKGLRQTVWTA